MHNVTVIHTYMLCFYTIILVTVVVAQGSSLGPLLFLINANKLPLQVTDGLLVQCADDTTLICSGPTPAAAAAAAALMNSQLQLVSNFISDSK